MALEEQIYLSKPLISGKTFFDISVNTAPISMGKHVLTSLPAP